MFKAEIETDPTSTFVVRDVLHHVLSLMAIHDVSDHVQQLGRVVQERHPCGGAGLLSAGQEDVSIVPGEGLSGTICSGSSASSSAPGWSPLCLPDGS